MIEIGLKFAYNICKECFLLTGTSFSYHLVSGFHCLLAFSYFEFLGQIGPKMDVILLDTSYIGFQNSLDFETTCNSIF